MSATSACPTLANEHEQAREQQPPSPTGRRGARAAQPWDERRQERGHANGACGLERDESRGMAHGVTPETGGARLVPHAPQHVDVARVRPGAHRRSCSASSQKQYP